MTQPVDTAEHRIERDTMGEVRVPAKALWKAQTQRAVENFPISGIPINSELIAALGLIKEGAAKTNATLGVLSQEYADAIANWIANRENTSPTAELIKAGIPT